jgi:hypothetical protein
MEAEVVDVSTYAIKAIILKAEKPARVEGAATNTRKMQLMLISKDTPSLNSYDLVTVNGVDWNVVHPVIDDGYTITVDITREV